jgi:hypothetical protein
MTQAPSKVRRRRLWWLGGIAAGAVVIAAAVVGWRLLRPRTVWTDGRNLSRPADRATVRQVLWAQPEALGEPLNTPQHEYEAACSPDGRELYFVRGLPGKGADLYVSRRRGRQWTQPQPLAAVNTRHDELGPRLSADGQLLLFYSDRPGGLGQYDIWASARTASGWGQAFNLGPGVNSKHNEYGAVTGPAGRRLYFATNRRAAARRGQAEPWRATIRQSEIGDYDLFVAEANGPPAAPATAPAEAPPVRFGRARALEGVNTLSHEGACCVSPGGDFLYFASDRPGGHGGFDLYRCRLLDGGCGPVEGLGGEVNTAANEADPQLDMGGFLLYFSSDRPASRGGYDLFASASREVYAMAVGPERPALGWEWWALLAALAVLTPLLLLLRAAGYRHLSLLQKCAVLSLLVHAVLTLLFSVVRISQEIIEYVAREAGMEVAVNLEVAREVETKMRIRRQISALPLANKWAVDLKRVEPAPRPRAAPRPVELNVPPAERRPAPLSIPPEAPRVVPPAPADRAELPPPPLAAQQPRIQITPPPPVSAAEEAPPPPPVALPVAARSPAEVRPRMQAQTVRIIAALVRPTLASMARPARWPRPAARAARVTPRVPRQPAIEVSPPRLRSRIRRSAPLPAEPEPNATAVVKAASPAPVRHPAAVDVPAPAAAPEAASLAEPEEPRAPPAPEAQRVRPHASPPLPMAATIEPPKPSSKKRSMLNRRIK